MSQFTSKATKLDGLAADYRLLITSAHTAKKEATEILSEINSRIERDKAEKQQKETELKKAAGDRSRSETVRAMYQIQLEESEKNTVGISEAEKAAYIAKIDQAETALKAARDTKTKLLEALKDFKGEVESLKPSNLYAVDLDTLSSNTQRDKDNFKTRFGA